jgi:8-oxo-dGTP pyrophosphatase MutT (NUDIX family)
LSAYIYTRLHRNYKNFFPEPVEKIVDKQRARYLLNRQRMKNSVEKSKSGRWTVKAKREIFKNEFFAVFEDDVIKPTGEDGKYATIHFKPGVAVLPIDHDDNVYLTKQFRYAIGRDDLEVAAGSIDGEDALEAAKRETKEELGIEADEWLDIGTVHSLTSITRCSSRQFIARKLRIGKQKTEGTEDIEIVKLPLQKACDMVFLGDITDADTSLLIFKAVAIKEKRQQT